MMMNYRKPVTQFLSWFSTNWRYNLLAIAITGEKKTLLIIIAGMFGL